jgi:DNA-binding transcriptional LysR family regulator
VHEVAETSTLVTFVAAGLGLAVVPEPTAALNVPGIVYVPLVGTPGVDLVAATRTGDDNPVLARALATLADLADR